VDRSPRERPDPKHDGDGVRSLPGEWHDTRDDRRDDDRRHDDGAGNDDWRRHVHLPVLTPGVELLA
jgi:hypothetical protein